MAIQLVWFNLLSFIASFAITLFFYSQPRSLLFAVALAIVLFVLFGVFALPGFFLAIVAVILLKKRPLAEGTKTNGGKSLRAKH